MARIPQPFLVSWKEIDEASDLDRLILVLSVLADEKLVSFLEQKRGKGRDDYPIRPMWNALLAGIVFQHKNAAELLRELRRNGELRQVCGFNPFLGANAVPTEYAFSRFLSSIVEQRDFVTEMFHELVDELKKMLPNLGVKTAVDSKAIPSFGNPVRDNLDNPDRRRDTDADWGKKTYKGTRKDGSTWEKVVKWCGRRKDSRHCFPSGTMFFVTTSRARFIAPVPPNEKARTSYANWPSWASRKTEILSSIAVPLPHLVSSVLDGKNVKSFLLWV